MQYSHRPYGAYEKYVKRPLDCILSIGIMLIFGVIALLVKIKLGSPVIFTQVRPGLIDKKTGREGLFQLYKFRTMTDERDVDGSLLPDEIRLTKFGKTLRSTSLDELPELVNVMRGHMALCGPRPQLVRDMLFMTEEQRERHTVRPGLTGLAQIRGRNAISWETKLCTDLEYIKKITFLGDLKIILETVGKVFKREGITEEGMETAADYGDYLLAVGKIDQEIYDQKQEAAKRLLDLEKSNRRM